MYYSRENVFRVCANAQICMQQIAMRDFYSSENMRTLHFNAL